jgi:hypothetical protein
MEIYMPPFRCTMGFGRRLHALPHPQGGDVIMRLWPMTGEEFNPRHPSRSAFIRQFTLPQY